MVRFLAMNVKAALDANGNCPKHWGAIIYVVYFTMWFWHDHVHCRVFGRGDGGKIQRPAVALL